MSVEGDRIVGVSSTITYRGLGSVVVLDLDGQTVTLTHEPPSEHHGTWVVPLDEITDVHYRERTVEAEGWAQIRTITSPTVLPAPAADPYAFRNGGEQLATFCLLIMYAATHSRSTVEGRAAREVIGEELTSIRAWIDGFRR